MFIQGLTKNNENLMRKYIRNKILARSFTKANVEYILCVSIFI